MKNTQEIREKILKRRKESPMEESGVHPEYAEIP